MRGPPITAAQVTEIRRLLSEGHSRRAVAALAGVSRASVDKYRSAEAVERRQAVSVRMEQKRKQARKERARAKAPPEHMAIKTAVPLLQELFDIAWRQGARQRDIAAAARVSPGAVQNWKKGKTDPTLRNLEAVADVLGYVLVLKPRE